MGEESEKSPSWTSGLKVTEFKGRERNQEEAHTWLRRAKIYINSKMKKATENERLEYLSAKLEDVAYDWYEDEQALGRVKTVALFEQQFASRFIEPRKEDYASVKNIKQQRGEQLLEYFTRCKMLSRYMKTENGNTKDTRMEA
eukprot:GHVU01202744.1.p1 GENE.GHVU01202744.1~~GHVU01202744.1.p1  ORF type:complete len:143 (-),score=30.82 GHVU01202744.1:87-515(-)